MDAPTAYIIAAYIIVAGLCGFVATGPRQRLCRRGDHPMKIIRRTPGTGYFTLHPAVYVAVALVAGFIAAALT